MKLTPKQRAFVDHYATCRNGAAAARLANYGAKSARVTASRLLTKTNIQAALAEKEAELRRIAEIDRARVVSEMLGAVEMAQQMLDAGNMIRGWTAVAKMLGLDKPEAERQVLSTTSSALEAKLAALSDEELFAIADGR